MWANEFTHSLDTNPKDENLNYRDRFRWYKVETALSKVLIAIANGEKSVGFEHFFPTLCSAELILSPFIASPTRWWSLQPRNEPSFAHSPNASRSAFFSSFANRSELSKSWTTASASLSSSSASLSLISRLASTSCPETQPKSFAKLPCEIPTRRKTSLYFDNQILS